VPLRRLFMPYFNSKIDYESATGNAVGFAANLNNAINSDTTTMARSQ